MYDKRFYRPAQKPTLGAMISFADRTIFEIATDVISGTNRSTRRISTAGIPRQCTHCGYYECICNTEAFEDMKRIESLDMPAAPLDEL